MEMAPIPGYPGYFATEDGHIYSDKSERVLAERYNTKGYKRVNLSVGGKHLDREVHKLVILAFKGEAPGFYVLHGPGGIEDNSPANLKYGTQRQNQIDRERDGTMVEAGRHTWATKLDSATVREIRTTYAAGGVLYKDLAEQYGVDISTIGDLIRRRTWSHVE